MAEPVSTPSDASIADRDEFFIGWLPMPRKQVRFLRPIVTALMLGLLGSAATMAFLQRDPGMGRWDVDTVRSFDGMAFTRPYAMIRVPSAKQDDPPVTMLLVEEGKFSALPRVERLVQEQAERMAVRVTGTILHREGRWMIELAEGEKGMRRQTKAEEKELPDLRWPAAQVLAEQTTLGGEIIDPKCYLGAMMPGGGKTHKACAMLCISGGVPPMLVTRDANKQETFYLLVTAEGGLANEPLLPFVGDRVFVTGRVERLGDVLVMRVQTAGVRRRRSSERAVTNHD